MARVHLLLCFTILFASVTLFDVASAFLKLKPSLPQIEDPKTVGDVEEYTVKVVMVFVGDLEKECPKTSKFKTFFDKLRGFAKYVFPLKMFGKKDDADMKAKEAGILKTIASFAVGRIKREIQEEKQEAIETFKFMKSLAGRIVGGRKKKEKETTTLTPEQVKEVKDGILKWQTVIVKIANTMVVSTTTTNNSESTTTTTTTGSSPNSGSSTGSPSNKPSAGTNSGAEISSKNTNNQPQDEDTENSASSGTGSSSNKPSAGTNSGVGTPSKDTNNQPKDTENSASSGTGSPSNKPSAGTNSGAGTSSKNTNNQSKDTENSASSGTPSKNTNNQSKDTENSASSETGSQSNKPSAGRNLGAETPSKDTNDQPEDTKNSASSRSTSTSHTKEVTITEIETQTSQQVMTFLMNLEKKCPPKEEYKQFFEKLKSTMTGSAKVSSPKKKKGLFAMIKGAVGKVGDAMKFLRSRIGNKSAEAKKSMETYQTEMIKNMEELNAIYVKIVSQNQNKKGGALTCTPEQQAEIKQTITKWEEVTTQFVEVAIKSETTTTSTSSSSSSTGKEAQAN